LSEPNQPARLPSTDLQPINSIELMRGYFRFGCSSVQE
jgi:hypothetical protein